MISNGISGLIDFRVYRVKVCVRLLTPVLMFILAFTLISGCKKQQKAPPPPKVEVVAVASKDVPVYSEWVGSLDGMVNATIRAQVQGYLVKQNYMEGEQVKKGQVLFEIDPRTFEAAKNQAKAELARTQARLRQTKANLARVRPLAAQNAVSKKDLDDAIGAEQSAEASVLSAKAVFDKTNLDLGFTKIKSPIDGIAGRAKAQIGNLVGPQQAEELTTVSTVNPIKAYISISEQEYLKLREARGNKQEQARKIPLQLILSTGKTYPYKGVFAFGERQIDEKTGTIRLTILFQNPDNLLRPGQFARVRALMTTKKNALVIPQRAVKEVQGKYLVAVVGVGNKVAIKLVKAAEKIGSLWVIDKGLQPGDQVVAEGVQKVKDGMVVSPKPFAEPQPPKPVKVSKDDAQPGKMQKTGGDPATPLNPYKAGSHG